MLTVPFPALYALELEKYGFAQYLNATYVLALIKTVSLCLPLEMHCCKKCQC